MFDLKLTHSSTTLGRDISSTSLPIEQEGVLLCSVLESGVEKVALLAAPAATDKVVGFAKLADAIPDRTSAVEEITVPAISAGFVEIDLRNNNLLTGSVLALITSTNVALTPDYAYAGAPAAGTVKIDAVNGKMKFDFTAAGLAIRLTYRYDLTMAQARQIFGERFINNRGLHSDFMKMELGSGYCELWTDAFDSNLRYDLVPAPALYCGANGIITTIPGGPALAATVIGIPNVSNPRLGVRITFM